MTISVDRHVWVPMPDGIRLAADVFRPAGGGRHPVVLLRTPYDRGHAAAFGLQINALRLAEAGYAVVTQDVRGRFDSEGEFEPFRAEGADGVASVLWAAGQPWSNGVVAMAGMSYCGYAQVLAARQRPEPLRAWIPAFCPLDARTEWIYDGDAFQLAFNLAWAIASIAGSDRRTADPAAVLATLDDWEGTIRRATADHPEILGTPAGAAAYGRWLERQDDSAWWAEVSGRGAGTHDAAALVVGGWFDVFHRGSLSLHAELSAGNAASTQLLLGPWDHSPLPLATGSGDIEYGWRASVDLPLLSMQWLDHVLRDGPAPLVTPARTFLTGANAWHDWDAWPPPADAASFHLAPGNVLQQDAPPASVDHFRADGADAAPSVGGRVYPRPRQMHPGQRDQGARAQRGDVRTFAAAPVARATLIAGPVRAEVWSGASPRSGCSDVAATLVDVAPDGTGLNVAEGVTRRVGVGPDPECFELDLGHVAHVLRSGHRLRLDVAGAAFPRVDRAHDRGTSERTIVLGGETPSRLVLPIVAGFG